MQGCNRAFLRLGQFGEWAELPATAVWPAAAAAIFGSLPEAVLSSATSVTPTQLQY